MLSRLEASGPTTNWYGLWDKVWAERNLLTAWYGVKRKAGAPGVDGQTIGKFDQQQERQLKKLEEELREGRYRPLPARRVWIPKPGTTEKRPLGIPVIRDRVVQNALKNVLEPIFERDFAEHSYGFRPGRSARQAIKRIEALMGNGNHWVVDADLRNYFDTIPHERLMKLVRQRITDGRVTGLVEQYLKAGVLEECRDWEPGEEGTPQGAVISPLLANLYLNELDHQMVRRGREMVRYADDFVVMCTTEEEAREVLEELKEWTAEVGLKLHDQKTRMVDASRESFDFLGWTLSVRKGRSRKWPRRKSQQKLRDKLRPLTKRRNSRSLEEIIIKVNQILKGWRGYFGESLPSGLSTEDSWVKRRLRSMFRTRQKRPGFGKTRKDHRQWSDQWFAEQGLYSLLRGT
jgi:RNA-directed DNA polymerase